MRLAFGALIIGALWIGASAFARNDLYDLLAAAIVLLASTIIVLDWRR